MKTVNVVLTLFALLIVAVISTAVYSQVAKAETCSVQFLHTDATIVATGPHSNKFCGAALDHKGFGPVVNDYKYFNLDCEENIGDTNFKVYDTGLNLYGSVICTKLKEVSASSGDSV